MVFGALGIVGGLCGGAGLLFLFKAMPKFAAQAQAARPGTPPMPDFFALLDKHVPGFVTYIWVSLGIAALMGMLLVACGIGLLKMRGWARWGSILYATVTILMQLAGVYFQLTSNMGPAMAAYQRELEDWQQQMTPGRPVVQNPALAMYENPTLTTALSIGGALFNMAYPIVLLVILLRPNVRAAFAAQPSPEDYPEVLPADGIRATRPNDPGGV
jgi:hypothetical protein